MIDALQGCDKGSKGRPTPAVQAFRDHAQSLTDSEAKMNRYLDTAPRARHGGETPSQHRRLIGKISNCDSFARPVSVDKVDVSYDYKEMQGRAFASSRGIQPFTRRMQVVLAPTTHDLDIKQVMFEMSYQLVDKLDLVDKDLFVDEIAVLEALATDRDKFAREELHKNPNEGKDALLKTVGGSSAFSGPGFTKVQRASRFLRWVPASCLP